MRKNVRYEASKGTNYFSSFSAKPKLWEVKRSSMVLIAEAIRVVSGCSHFARFDSLHPSQQFSVMSGWVFLGDKLEGRAQGHNAVPMMRL